MSYSEEYDYYYSGSVGSDSSIDDTTDSLNYFNVSKDQLSKEFEQNRDYEECVVGTSPRTCTSTENDDVKNGWSILNKYRDYLNEKSVSLGLIDRKRIFYRWHINEDWTTDDNKTSYVMFTCNNNWYVLCECFCYYCYESYKLFVFDDVKDAMLKYNTNGIKCCHKN